MLIFGRMFVAIGLGGLLLVLMTTVVNPINMVGFLDTVPAKYIQVVLILVLVSAIGVSILPPRIVRAIYTAFGLFGLVALSIVIGPAALSEFSYSEGSFHVHISGFGSEEALAAVAFGVLTFCCLPLWYFVRKFEIEHNCLL